MGCAAFLLEQFGAIIGEVERMQQKPHDVLPFHVLGEFACQVLDALPLLSNLLLEIAQVFDDAA